MQALTLPAIGGAGLASDPDTRQIKKGVIEEALPRIGKPYPFNPAAAEDFVLLPDRKGSIIVCITFAVAEYLYSAIKA
jgi:hypothetical protein